MEGLLYVCCPSTSSRNETKSKDVLLLVQKVWELLENPLGIRLYVFLLLIICSIQLQGTRVFEQTEWHYWAMGVSFHLALLFMDRTRRVKMVFVKILLLESHQLQFTEFKQTAVNLSNHLLPGKDSADRDVHLQPGMSRSYFKSKL